MFYLVTDISFISNFDSFSKCDAFTHTHTQPVYLLNKFSGEEKTETLKPDDERQQNARLLLLLLINFASLFAAYQHPTRIRKSGLTVLVDPSPVTFKMTTNTRY